MELVWLTGLTVPWLIATVWLSGRHLMGAVDPAGSTDIFDSGVIAPFILLFIAPLGIGWAAHAAGFTPWLWLLYLMPYALVVLFLVFALGVWVYSWWWRRARSREKTRARGRR
jgi:hypothetical protein